MIPHKIITLTGGDCAGKATQSGLLIKVLKPSKLMSAPDYGHWAGRIVGCILRKQDFTLGTLAQGSAGVYKQKKHPQILQLLHNINTWDKQETIREGLQSHHWVMDRYIEDAYAFGLQDGCSLDFLLELNRNFIQSDIVIPLLGEGFPRPGEIPDINEQNDAFQRDVRRKYWSLSTLFENWHPINIDLYQRESKYRSIAEIHSTICEIVSKELGNQVDPLPGDQVEYWIRLWEERKQLQQVVTETSS